MRATQAADITVPWFQPCYARHRFVAIYISILLRNNSRYFGN